jgi:mono/diheme cytochrome c family protein
VAFEHEKLRKEMTRFFRVWGEAGKSTRLAAAGFVLLVAITLLPATNVRAAASASHSSQPTFSLNAARKSASDLEVGGELAGLPRGATRYVTLASLLALPQVTYTVTDDTNFAGAAGGGTKISGVALEELARALAAAPESDMVVAICDDKYRANYPRDYVKAHHPLLVLRVNGRLAPGWPKDRETHQFSMGPYMISHPKFTPAFTALSHTDEAQIPWGVVRIEFRDERAVFGAIAPRGPRAQDAAVQAGYRIAEQNCFRCHNMGGEGGEKSGRPWLVLSAWAAAAPEYFSAYVRDPKKKNRHAEMPPNRGYDDATLRAIREYFATFIPVPGEKP